MMYQKQTVTITYLEQRTQQFRAPAAKPDFRTALMRSHEPPLHFYRYLFNQIGEPWKWVSRRYMDDDTLAGHIHDPDVYIYVLYIEGSPCGMAEIDARKIQRDRDRVEIKFFGFMPDYTGKGFGRWFFQNILDLAWSLEPPKVVLETCTADHPAALVFYQKMGFSVYSQAEGIIEWQG